MKKEIAEEFMAENLKLYAQLSAMIEKTDQIESVEESREMRRNLGNVMAAIDLHLFRTILKQYPELDPHR